MQNKIEQALEIAATADVSTLPNTVVVYSISYMPNSQNKEQALTYIRNHPDAKMIDHTPCGKALIDLGLDGKVNEVGEEITRIWRLASERFIAQASGNVHAFVAGADKRSTFCSTELGEILKNPQITEINGIDKQKFAESFIPQEYN